MVSDLGISLGHLERATPIVSGFLVGYAAGIPLFGALSDARGRAGVFVAALVLFAVGSAVTASAGDLNRVIAGRAVQGFAGGALVPISLAVVADLFPERRARALALGLVAGAQELGSLAGPVYGAAVSQWAAALGGWRAVFWLNLPLAALCAVGFLAATRNTPRLAAERPAAGKVAPRLAAGALLGTAMALLVVALYPSDPAQALFSAYAAPLLVGAAGALGLYFALRRERLRAWAPVSVNVLVGAALVAALAEVPVLGSTLFGLDQTGSALLLTRFLLGVPVGALLGGWLSGFDRRLPAVGGMAISALCFWRMTGWAGQDASVPFVLFGCGLGFGLVIAPVLAAILETAAAEEHGAASALAVLARTGGMVAGIALLAAYGFHRFYSELAACPPATTGGGFLPLPNPAFVRCATGAARDQYHDVFLIAAVLCVIAGLLSLGLTGTRHARLAL